MSLVIMLNISRAFQLMQILGLWFLGFSEFVFQVSGIFEVRQDLLYFLWWTPVPVRPSVRAKNLDHLYTGIYAYMPYMNQAYMPYGLYESSKDSSNQPDGPMESPRCPP